MPSPLIQPGPISERRFRHHIALRHRAGPLDLDLSFTLDTPWTALFAPSGAGKTTILRMVAGLDRPDWGRIVSHLNLPSMPERECVLLDTQQRISVPTHKRAIRMVTQRPALFPHRSVLENIRYGDRGLPSDEDEHASAKINLEGLLNLCRLDHLEDKMPSQLSGGERQRVALARALNAGGGRLLLLDEPFTGLEADLRDALIHDLRVHLLENASPVLLVTHDLGEVFAANAHVLKMESGRIVAQGPAEKVLARERDRLIARLT